MSEIHQVFEVRATNEEGTFFLNIDLTDANGERYVCDYVSRPSDTFGLNPMIRQWLADHPDFPITPLNG